MSLALLRALALTLLLGCSSPTAPRTVHTGCAYTDTIVGPDPTVPTVLLSAYYTLDRCADLFAAFPQNMRWLP